jgi:hypothetical protein
MDLRAYYQKIREVEAQIADAFPIVVSVETADGGRAGAFTEVGPRTAAKMVVDGIARLAESEEAQAFREQQAEQHRIVQEQASAGKVQLSVIPTGELNQLRAALRPKD